MTVPIEEPDQSGCVPAAVAKPDSPSVVYSIPGSGSSTGCVVKSGVPATPYPVDTRIWLGWSTSVNILTGRPTGTILQTSDLVGSSFQAMLKHTVSGLAASTTYYASLSTTNPSSSPMWIGDPIRFRTFPPVAPAAAPVTVKWALGSCQYLYCDAEQPTDVNGDPLQTAWIDLRNWAIAPGGRLGADILWDIGDFHYEGGDPGNKYGDPLDPLAYARMYWLQIAGLPEMRKTRALMLEDQVSDDHEFSGNNGNSNGSTTIGTHRKAQMAASEYLFPMYPLHQTGAIGSKTGLYGSYKLSPQVRVIVLDSESLGRSVQTFDLGDNKNFLGDAQTTWLKGLLEDQPVTLNIFVCSKSWIGRVDAIEDNDLDKIWAYDTWRTNFGAYIDDLNDKAEKGLRPRTNILYMGGDRHKIGHLAGANNPWGHFPCYVGSGWSHHHLSPVLDEVCTSPTGFDPAYEGYQLPPEQEGNHTYLTMQYVRGTIVDDGANGVTVTGQLRYLVPDLTKPRRQWTMGQWGNDQIDHFPKI